LEAHERNHESVLKTVSQATLELGYQELDEGLLLEALAKDTREKEASLEEREESICLLNCDIPQGHETEQSYPSLIINRFGTIIVAEFEDKHSARERRKIILGVRVEDREEMGVQCKLNIHRKGSLGVSKDKGEMGACKHHPSMKCEATVESYERGVTRYIASTEWVIAKGLHMLYARKPLSRSINDGYVPTVKLRFFSFYRYGKECQVLAMSVGGDFILSKPRMHSMLVDFRA
jgi:hypothetical protein